MALMWVYPFVQIWTACSSMEHNGSRMPTVAASYATIAVRNYNFFGVCSDPTLKKRKVAKMIVKIVDYYSCC